MAKKINLSVIVPVYNEAKTIRKVLHALIKVADVAEVVVVDDASSDDSMAEIKKVTHKKLVVAKHVQNRGKGKAIQTGLLRVRGNYVLIQDADLEYDPLDIPSLLEPIKREKTQVVYGSRFLGSRSNMFFWHFVGNKLLNFLVNILYDSILTDLETCYKVMPTDLLKALNLKENDFRIEMEMTCKLLRKRERIIEVPINYVARSYEEGKKITWIDGVYALKTMMLVRLGRL